MNERGRREDLNIGRPSTAFERQIALPQGVEADKVIATYKHGVLEVRVPLPAQLTGRKVPVQIEEKDKKKLESKAA